MKGKRKFCFLLFILIVPLKLLASTVDVVPEIQTKDGGVWTLQKKNESYYLDYKKPGAELFSNHSIIDSDVSGSDISLDIDPHDIVSLVVNLPRDTYSFKISSDESPRILSACKQIILSSADDDQAATLISLCSTGSILKNAKFSSAKAVSLLDSKNLYLERETKVVISVEKSFLYDENNIPMKNNPYLIKGDVVEVVEYKNDMLKINYQTKKGNVTGWIEFPDIL